MNNDCTIVLLFKVILFSYHMILIQDLIPFKGATFGSFPLIFQFTASRLKGINAINHYFLWSYIFNYSYHEKHFLFNQSLKYALLVPLSCPTFVGDGNVLNSIEYNTEQYLISLQFYNTKTELKTKKKTTSKYDKA